MTTTIRMQHGVREYEAWKAMFDSDPLDRKGGGVTAYRIARPTDDPKVVLVDLDFEDSDRAEAFLVRLRELWAGPAAATIHDVDARVVEIAESAQL